MSEAEPDDGLFAPMVMTINGCSDVRTDDHKALIIRLELPYGEYWQMEQALQVGIDAHLKRHNDLEKLAAAVTKGEATLTEPLTVLDVKRAADLAMSAHYEAKALLKKIARPKD